MALMVWRGDDRAYVMIPMFRSCYRRVALMGDEIFRLVGPVSDGRSLFTHAIKGDNHYEIQ